LATAKREQRGEKDWSCCMHTRTTEKLESDFGKPKYYCLSDKKNFFRLAKQAAVKTAHACAYNSTLYRQ